MPGRFQAVSLLATLLLAAVATGQQGELRPIYGGPAYYPRAVELADGALLVSFDHPIPGGMAIACIRSTDGGRTWGDYRRIAQDQGRVDVANAFPIQLADGTVLVAYRHHTLDQRIYRLHIAASGDAGRHWRFHSAIATGSVGLWEPFLFQAAGSLQVYYASEEGIYPDQRIEMKASPDGGRTWGPPSTIARKPGSRDGMPAVVRAADGSLLACFEASDLPPFRFIIRTVGSKDDGLTWTAQRQLVYQPANPARQRWAAGAPYMVRRQDGRLLISFQTDEDVPYQHGDDRADPAAAGYRYEKHTTLKLISGGDGGEPARPLAIAGAPDSPATWGSLYILRDGRILALTTWRGGIWCRELADEPGMPNP
jgi:hypothetical protein